MPKLTGIHLAAVLVVGIFCLTVIAVVGMWTDHDSTLVTGVVGGIAAALGLAAGIVIPGSRQ